MKKTPGIFILMSTVILVSAAAAALAQSAALPKRGPLNPEFVEYLRARTLSRAVPRTADGHTLGLIPLPVLPSNVRPATKALDRLGPLPVTFDLRDVSGKLPVVRDQGSCGSCWAFATYGTLESYFCPGEILDLSEQNLIDHSGFSYGPCDGGNIYMSLAYLARWAGPVAEADDPYVHLSAYPGSMASSVRKHVQDAAFFPKRSSSLDNDLIKSSVANDAGVVYVSMYWANSGYNATHSSYYNNGVTSEPFGGGHAVCIVGWDDNYPASNFNVAPPGNGAFIVRNSWGPSWGEAGYFYVSYYDTQFARRDVSAVLTAESTGNYSGVFQYDPLGWCDNWGYSGSETAWAANVFTAPTRTSIAAAGFYAVSANCAYEVRVYTGATGTNPRAGTLRATATGTCDIAGYATIPLPSPVTVTAGQKFSVVVKFTTPGHNFPVAAEEKLSGYSNGAVAHIGESLLSSNGSTWADLMRNASLSPFMINFCIKAYTAPVPSIAITDPAAGARWMRGTTQTIAWTKSGAQADTVRIQLFQGTTKVSDITLATENDGSFDWAIPAKLAPRTDYTVRVTTTDGKVRGTSARFAVIKPTLMVTAPAASAVWTRGTTQTIMWTKNGPQNDLVRIQLIRYGVLIKEISAGAANGGAFVWAIPTNVPKGGGYKVRIKTVDNLVRDDSGLFALR